MPRDPGRDTGQEIRIRLKRTLTLDEATGDISSDRLHDIGNIVGFSQHSPPHAAVVQKPIHPLVAPHRDMGVAIEVEIPKDDPAEPVGARNPAVLYGLGNILENAVDFARHQVQVAASWDGDHVNVVVGDDGSGFPPEIIDRMGEPYVTSEQGRRMRGREMPGLGLGFFIAKTLLARSGAKISLKNKQFPQRGAIVRVRWNRADFERPLISQPADDTIFGGETDGSEAGESSNALSQPSINPGSGGADKSEKPPLAEIH